MPTNIETIVNNYENIKKVILANGFQKAKLFKGFSSDEESSFNLLVEDTYRQKDEPKSQLSRLIKLEEELVKLLNCKVNVTETTEMDPYFLAKLDNRNSVSISQNSVSGIALQFKKCFGDTWQFDPIKKTKTHFFLDKQISSKQKWPIEKNKIDIPNLVEEELGDILSLLADRINKLEDTQSSIDTTQLLNEIKDNLQNKLSPRKLGYIATSVNG